jgi:hypothetical protein
VNRFPRGGASKKRPSSHLHSVPTRSNEVSPRTFQTALVQLWLMSFSCRTLSNDMATVLYLCLASVPTVTANELGMLSFVLK